MICNVFDGTLNLAQPVCCTF